MMLCLCLLMHFFNGIHSAYSDCGECRYRDVAGKQLFMMATLMLLSDEQVNDPDLTSLLFSCHSQF